ncbi:MAG TPA: Ig-like domain-containing protein [Solirubrobacteraceae bacterium]|nr:Ig-like domain-containing protein [Solirubrobacteraceae bacterium]
MPTTAPFTQCPAVFLDASCGYLIDITNAAQPTILHDAEVGFYEGGDDILVGIQNDSSAPISSMHLGVAGSGQGSFSFDGDGLCTPGGPPIPGECPFGPSATDPYDYWGPDAELVPDAESIDAGTVKFPEPLQPGQYTYFSLESFFGVATLTAGNGNDLITTRLSYEGSAEEERVTSPTPVNVTDHATLTGVHATEAEIGSKVVYHLYEDASCTKEITESGKPAGGEKAIETIGLLPPSNAVGASLATNHVYYWKASFEGDKQNTQTEGNCGGETMTFGTPPTRSAVSIATELKGSNGASGASITVPVGSSVTDSASVSFGGAGQSGKVTYYVYQDTSCTQQVAGAKLGSVASGTGTYGASLPVTLPLGTYYFQAIYSGNGSVAPARSTCGAEVLSVVTPPPPCTCASIKTYLNKFSVFGAHSTRLGMHLNIALACTAGSGGGCLGEVIVHAPAGAKFIDTAKHPKGVKGFSPTEALKIACAGPCAGTTIQRVSLTWLALKKTRKKKGNKTITTTRPIRSFLPQGRAKTSKVIIIETICHAAGGANVTARLSMTVHFDKHGQVEYKLSDLNGDLKPDGKQLNEF